ncbi:thymidylate kinase [Clostridium argentinense CDC 2741]|uniref:Thymidylate kinase n=1 Tax=Clostridium argentinense CDC 2741 TaxID=1418104 RepID=A0A0C1R566_9CLOT|nr:dTMP kinase [Clostridium argentinense]ARC83235.1 dTMP kinase [Clostridium argentinense]KIE45626.1 thymidylate kinase [Clostridium argentinense CDC 2741]NFF41540.1 dTMP kinase [Clostridium argentinense]NFP52178.1 dTMP kinase [Clostridium argentinense]NFP74600.1 dTMP kinase [Clostridium argentinense]
MKKGLLIALEGPDGSGKSTQIRMLCDYLENKSHEVLLTREPGGTDISEKIRQIILDNSNAEMCGMCEALLYASSRAQLAEEVLKPALERGCIVLSDRFVYSSIVYQGIGRGLGIDRIKYINNAALNGVKADLTIMINVSYEEGLRRKLSQRDLDRLENSGNNFHKKVYEGYQYIATNMDNIVVIDGNRSLQEVHEDIIREVEKFIG